MHRTYRPGLAAFIAGALLLIHPAELRAHREYVHQYLVVEAYRLLLERYPGLSSTVMAGHVGGVNGGCEGFPFTLATVTAGAYREDCEDPVFHYGDVVEGLDNAYFSASHFWDADAGDGSTIRICDVTCGTYQNAYRKTLRYVLPGVHGRWTAKLTWPAGISSFQLQGGGTTTIVHNGLIGFEYDTLTALARSGACAITGYMDITGKWQTASTVPDQLPRRIIAPRDVRERISWEVVGRIAHLLGDMGVPAHAHNDIHPPFWWGSDLADVYEDQMAELYGAWDHADAAAQGGLLDVRRVLRDGSAERVMRYLVYTTNQIADRFPSNDGAGDDAFERSIDGDDYSILDIVRDIDVDPHPTLVFHRETADHAFVYSIRSIATLLEWFALESGILARISIDAEYPGVTLTVNGKPRTTPHLLILPSGTPFTLEAADQPATDPRTGAALTLGFQGWLKSSPSEGERSITVHRLEETADDGSAYVALFNPLAKVEVSAPALIDGGTGGHYLVNGANVGREWSAVLNSGDASGITLDFVPPPGSVFVGWSDGGRTNPRLVRADADLHLRAIAKRHLLTTVPPGEWQPNQRRIARTVPGTDDAALAVMTYGSSGEIFVSTSTDGVTWGPEEMVSDGRGISRDPSIDDILLPDGALTVVAWEECGTDGSTRSVVARTRDRGVREWSARRILGTDAPADPVRAAPVTSGGLVVWRETSGLRLGRIADGASFPVPGTGPASAGQAIDDAGAGGAFGVSWVEGGSAVWFVRGSGTGGTFATPRLVASTAAPESIRDARVALSSTGAGAVAWLTSAEGEWRGSVRTFDPADLFQPPTLLPVCAGNGDARPSMWLSHHRADAVHPKDIGVHLWNAGTPPMSTLLLRSNLRIGPYATSPPPGHPELPASATQPGGQTPIVLCRPAADGCWELSGAALSLDPGPPGVPTPVSPAPGATGVGGEAAFSWSCAADASSFDVQVSRDESFSGALVADRRSVAGTTVTIGSLEPGTTYFWRVRSTNSLGSGDFTGPIHFSTGAGPDAPSLSGTVTKTGKGSFPKLGWGATLGAEAYRLYRYVCNEPSECAIASLRPALVYEGPLTSFVDGGIPVGSKASTGLACYFVRAAGGGFTGPISNTVSFPTSSAVIWSEEASGPRSTGLLGSHPNPFNPSTTITYSLAGPGRAVISAWNVLGEKVAVLYDGVSGPGTHEVRWDASGLPAGVYLLSMETFPSGGSPPLTDRRKVILLK